MASSSSSSSSLSSHLITSSNPIECRKIYLKGMKNGFDTLEKEDVTKVKKLMKEHPQMMTPHLILAKRACLLATGKYGSDLLKKAYHLENAAWHHSFVSAWIHEKSKASIDRSSFYVADDADTFETLLVREISQIKEQDKSGKAFQVFVDQSKNVEIRKDNSPAGLKIYHKITGLPRVSSSLKKEKSDPKIKPVPPKPQSTPLTVTGSTKKQAVKLESRKPDNKHGVNLKDNKSNPSFFQNLPSSLFINPLMNELIRLTTKNDATEKDWSNYYKRVTDTYEKSLEDPLFIKSAHLPEVQPIIFGAANAFYLKFFESTGILKADDLLKAKKYIDKVKFELISNKENAYLLKANIYYSLIVISKKDIGPPQDIEQLIDELIFNVFQVLKLGKEKELASRTCMCTAQEMYNRALKLPHKPQLESLKVCNALTEVALAKDKDNPFTCKIFLQFQFDTINAILDCLKELKGKDRDQEFESQMKKKKTEVAQKLVALKVSQVFFVPFS